MTNLLSTSYLETVSKDGWWPYVPGHGASLEATAWCAIACRKNHKLAEASLWYLLNSQNKDGGWSTAPNSGESDWSTGLALLAINLLRRELSAGGLKIDYPIEDARKAGFKSLTGLRTDLITDLTRVGYMLLQGPDFDYPRGWPWEPNTYHWVEPTSYAILAIKSSPYANEKRYKSIVKEAVQYLFEKACTPAGWNFGSAQTLGKDWPPLPSPTALALIALQGEAHPQVDKALAWLRGLQGPLIDTTISDGLATIARDAHGEDMSSQAQSINDRFAQRQTGNVNLCAVAAATIAANLKTDGNPFKLTSA